MWSLKELVETRALVLEVDWASVLRVKKLEWWATGLRKKFDYLHPSGYNTRTWPTDRLTEGDSEDRAYASSRGKNCVWQTHRKLLTGRRMRGKATLNLKPRPNIYHYIQGLNNKPMFTLRPCPCVARGNWFPPVRGLDSLPWVKMDAACILAPCVTGPG